MTGQWKRNPLRKSLGGRNASEREREREKRAAKHGLAKKERVDAAFRLSRGVCVRCEARCAATDNKDAPHYREGECHEFDEFDEIDGRGHELPKPGGPIARRSSTLVDARQRSSTGFSGEWRFFGYLFVRASQGEGQCVFEWALDVPVFTISAPL